MYDTLVLDMRQSFSSTGHHYRTLNEERTEWQIVKHGQRRTKGYAKGLAQGRRIGVEGLYLNKRIIRGRANWRTRDVARKTNF